jgi:CheY-like chemotaxis protein
MKLLIVDDNSDTRKLIRSIMKPYGHEVMESQSGADAVRSFAVHHPDCVLMDIEMEGMDGLTATKSIIESHPDAKVIIVTMHDSPRLRLAATEAGASGYVVKEKLTELPGLLKGINPHLQ